MCFCLMWCEQLDVEFLTVLCKVRHGHSCTTLKGLKQQFSQP